jgi:hypothetical protein
VLGSAVMSALLSVGPLLPASGAVNAEAIEVSVVVPEAALADRTAVLDRPVNGDAAVMRAGGMLPALAARNDTSASELVALLRSDHSMWLDQAGWLHAKDPKPASAADAEPADAGPFPYDQTFRLHSHPGAQRVLYLDFDGEVVSGTSWNASYDLSSDPQPAFDFDGSPATWSQAEQDVVQGVYQRVAEDFAPFDVDVTTQDPGAAALDRSDTSDMVYGTRVLITPSVEAHQKICGSTCGGVAYVGVFNRTASSYYHPAWVFAQTMLNSPKYIAAAASHEAGHNLGLGHDGTATAPYYNGHSNWGPIMGSGYYAPLTQWSKGEYPSANNSQDDLTVIGSYGVPVRADDHGSTLASARVLGSSTSTSGVIERPEDKDVFSISRSCGASTTISLTTPADGPNLDGKLRLLDASGQLLAEDDPGSGPAQVGFDAATGLSASVTANLSPGNYYLEVDGVGARDLVTGYSDYGSLGQYDIAVSACPSDPAPTVTSRVPAVGGTGVAVGNDIQADFSEAVTGVSATTFTLRSSAGVQVAAAVGYNATLRRAWLNPSASLAPNQTYTATLTGGASAIRDLANVPLATTTWSFTTFGDPAPTVTSRVPAVGGTGVAVGNDIQADFSEAVTGVSATTFTLRSSAGVQVAAAVGYNATLRRAWLNPSASLAPNQTYTATLTGGASAIRDLANVPLATTTWSFTTGGDTTAPTITTRTPASGATGVSRSANVTATMSEAVTGVSGATFTIRNAVTGVAVSAVVSRNGTTNQWILNPGATLAAGTRYDVTLTGGPGAVRDLGNNALVTTTWSFTTGA